ncbi:mannosyl-glycoprotein endo-beta-N-acetylglucosamidase [Brevibacillus laterosporus]|nr:glycoside hydrolase family 73 protein [Brevibacillus laterosporus]TPG74307.1 mannosyl-glycoprotein endo-beta-N-acetylglucosamidase [Brevibacillus laterosporus]
MKPQDFIDKIAPGAVADMKKTKIPASLTIAQAILESAWGESGLTKQGNNLFGIKGTGPAGVCAMPTKENYNGQWTTITANFRAYNNWGESIADHSKLILNGTRDKPTRYHGVLGADYKTACHAIHKGGYATDPGYPGKLIGLIEKYGLATYDKEELTVKPEVANEVINHLKGQWAMFKQLGMKDEAIRIGVLADELRAASGQEKQNEG